MANQSRNAIDQRGGVPLRDYTQDGRALQSRGILGGVQKVNFDQVGRALVWFSLGLGILEVVAPKRVQRWVGVRKGDHSGLIRLLGIREITSAMMIFLQSRPHAGAWARVVGDAMDLGLLGAAFTSPKVKKNQLSVAAASVAGITAVDAFTAARLRSQRSEEKQYSVVKQSDLDGRLPNGGFHVMRSVTINKSPEELYQYWHNFENLPRFMYHLESVQVMDERRSHWVAKAPAGMRVEWDAEITEDRPNERIAWRSTENAQVPNSGVVRFQPATGGEGTVVRVEIDYSPPGGAAGRIIAKLFGEEPGQQVIGDLNRFKQVMETGEVVLSDSVLKGYGQKSLRPARPPSDDVMDEVLRVESYQQR